MLIQITKNEYINSAHIVRVLFDKENNVLQLETATATYEVAADFIYTAHIALGLHIGRK